MASFMSSFFPSGKQQDKPDERPTTPTKGSVANNFTTPISTPQGSPSKKTVPPGANELPTSIDNMKLSATSIFDSPVKLNRPQGGSSIPLSTGRTNLQIIDEGSPSIENSIIHKGTSAAGSPPKGQSKENTPPVITRTAPTEPAPTYQPSHAALSRQDGYHLRERPAATVKRFNTQRGLTAEELEILQKPNIKRLVNVTQLCKSCSPRAKPLTMANSVQTSLITTLTSSPTLAQGKTASMLSTPNTLPLLRRTKRHTTKCGPSTRAGSGPTFASAESD